MNKFGKSAYILAMERGNEIIARAIQKKIDQKKALEDMERVDTDGETDIDSEDDEEATGNEGKLL